MPDLHKIEPVSHAIAKSAVEAWHYSHRMPQACADLRFGVFEGGVFVGVVLFGPGAGAATTFGRRFGVDRKDVRELVRVALTTHQTPTSRIVAICIRLLRKVQPTVRLLMSYADTAQGHHGGIYQAGGWVLTGSPGRSIGLIRVRGEVRHPRSVFSSYGTRSIRRLRVEVDPEAEPIITPPKHRYVMALDPTIAPAVKAMAQPYPKRARSEPADTATLQVAEDGAAPILALNPPEPKAA